MKILMPMIRKVEPLSSIDAITKVQPMTILPELNRSFKIRYRSDEECKLLDLNRKNGERMHSFSEGWFTWKDGQWVKDIV
jgi:hypothetical protein